jgi:hypothetical protein
MDKYFSIYQFVKEKRKERFDIILEPLQAITQLALLSACPKGSKLTISNNILSIQEPGWFQGLLRSYNKDVKEDLFYLFNAITRFNRFYDFLKNENNDCCDLFDLLIQMSKRGIDKLVQTYSNTEQPALLHTLQLYRVLLDKPLIITEHEENELSKHQNTHNSSKHNKHTKHHNNTNNSNNTNNTIETNTKPTHIDDLFINIRSLYSIHDYYIIYQILMLVEKNPENYDKYIYGLNVILTPIYDKIQKWICNNIVY